MSTRSHRLMLFLAAVSVAGVLSMHGLDPVVATVDQHHGGHVSDTETSGDAHAAIGLCVFVVAVVFFGLALVRRLQQATSRVNFGYPPGRFLRSQSSTMSGPPLFLRLCVLRL